MNPGEMVDKENIVPLGSSAKTGGHTPNLPVKQILMKEREDLEYEIRTYRGRDPLEPHYNYVLWLEKNSNDDITPVLENILVKFKEVSTYKQDPRLIHILVEYISAQSNPAEVYQIVHDQGLGTKCSLFYIRWAKELEKNNDFQTADQIFQLGIKCRAQPENDLQNAHLQFQLNIARRVLEGGIDIVGKESHPTTRTVAFSQRSTQIQNRDRKLPNAGGFEKVEEIEGRRMSNAEGCWSEVVPKQLHPSHAQIHAGSRKVERPNRKSEFRCPIAIFEPPDPLKKAHYPKHLVYVNGRDVQLEEIRATERARRESLQQVEEPMNLTKSSNTRHIVTQSLLPSQSNSKHGADSNLPLDQSLCLRTEFVQPVEKPLVQSLNSNPSQEQSVCLETEFIRPVENPPVTEPKKSNSIRDQGLYLDTEFIQPVEKPRVVEPVAIVAQRTAGPSTADLSIRDQSWYLRTDFVEPVKTVQLPESQTVWKLVAESHSSTESTLLKRKSEMRASTQETERAQRLNEEEVFDLSCHSSRGNTSALHHSPTASFTVNTRAAMNLIQKMWESPLAPRSVKVSKTAEGNDFFKMPIARKPEYCMMTDEVDYASSLMTLEDRRRSDLPKPASVPVFDVFCEEDANPQQDVYARLSCRSSTHRVLPIEDRLSSSMNSLEVCGERKCETKVVPAPSTIPLPDVPQQLENKENDLIADENDEDGNIFDDTCSTKAFQKLLPSSTPFSRPDRSRRGRTSSMFNGSYIEEDERPIGAGPQPYLVTMNTTKNPTNLSLILENSKEHGSSSGGTVPKSFS